MGVMYQVSNNHGLDIKGVRAVYTTYLFLDGCNLFSGDDTDPVNWAMMDAYNVAKDDNGRDLPFDVTISLPAICFDRDSFLVEDLSRMKRAMNQKVCVHIVVFKDLSSYTEYMESNNCIIHQE